MLVRGILLPDVETGERGLAKDARWPLVRAGEPACETREGWLPGAFRRGPEPNAAREAGRFEDECAIALREAEEAVGMLYLAGAALGRNFVGVLGVAVSEQQPNSLQFRCRYCYG